MTVPTSRSMTIIQLLLPDLTADERAALKQLLDEPMPSGALSTIFTPAREAELKARGWWPTAAPMSDAELAARREQATHAGVYEVDLDTLDFSKARRVTLPDGAV